ncbi:hypothetical protein BDN70DRAFT_924307 [Pholiota conissans]|uniref:Uncharacterized protein n=1 Tax=Pholiota conissans TaxID=109636 RepID=A0A9P5YSA8_9AGAR|nr:hypothetical protein BDN70DRAFT_924307 [Pholiota conissans]
MGRHTVTLEANWSAVLHEVREKGASQFAIYSTFGSKKWSTLKREMQSFEDSGFGKTPVPVNKSSHITSATRHNPFHHPSPLPFEMRDVCIRNPVPSPAAAFKKSASKRLEAVAEYIRRSYNPPPRQPDIPRKEMDSPQHVVVATASLAFPRFLIGDNLHLVTCERLIPNEKSIWLVEKRRLCQDSKKVCEREDDSSNVMFCRKLYKGARSAKQEASTDGAQICTEKTEWQAKSH